MTTCVICGKEVEKMPFEDVCSMECYTEKFWLEKEEGYLNGVPYIIIDGTMYKDAGYKNPISLVGYEDKTLLRSLGHGGAEYNIKMNDGTEIFTNNLWYIGDVPENHKEILKDNAVFL